MKIQVNESTRELVVRSGDLRISTGTMRYQQIEAMIEDLQGAIDDLCRLLPFEDRVVDPLAVGISIPTDPALSLLTETQHKP